jgi:hypothetical protein
VVPAGSSTDVSGAGFPPGQPVLTQLFSDPVTLGSAIADASGAVHLTVTIPASTPPGIHTLVLTGPGGVPRAEAPLTVSAPAAPVATTTTQPVIGPFAVAAPLARTGIDARPAARLATLLVVLGGMLVALAWSRGQAAPFPARRRHRRWP